MKLDDHHARCIGNGIEVAKDKDRDNKKDSLPEIEDRTAVEDFLEEEGEDRKEEDIIR